MVLSLRLIFTFDFSVIRKLGAFLKLLGYFKKHLVHMTSQWHLLVTNQKPTLIYYITDFQ